METSKQVGDNLNDKNIRLRRKKLKKLLKKKKYNNYMSILEPKKRITARDILIRTGQIKEEII